MNQFSTFKWKCIGKSSHLNMSIWNIIPTIFWRVDSVSAPPTRCLHRKKSPFGIDSPMVKHVVRVYLGRSQPPNPGSGYHPRWRLESSHRSFGRVEDKMVFFPFGLGGALIIKYYRWWFQQFSYFSPRTLGKWSNLTSIFSTGLKPPTRI